MIPKSGSGLAWTALRAALVKAYYTGQIRPIKLSANHLTFAHPFCSIPSCSDFDSGPNLTCQLRKKPNTQHGHLLLFASSSFSSCFSDWGWNTGPMILSVIFFSTCQSSAIVHSRISFCFILIIHTWGVEITWNTDYISLVMDSISASTFTFRTIVLDGYEEEEEEKEEESEA